MQERKQVDVDKQRVGDRLMIHGVLSEEKKRRKVGESQIAHCNNPPFPPTCFSFVRSCSEWINEWMTLFFHFCIWTNECLRGKNKTFWQNGTTGYLYSSCGWSYGEYCACDVLFLFHSPHTPSLTRSLTEETVCSKERGDASHIRGRNGSLFFSTRLGLQTKRRTLKF